ncbi:hypothetical protein BC833DRAFT_617680 [Globomyces pollinis-pini]|nr:hypothetical protein BC833DRAFT_617680 [Globomyces pollinis-pini]
MSGDIFSFSIIPGILLGVSLQLLCPSAIYAFSYRKSRKNITGQDFVAYFSLFILLLSVVFKTLTIDFFASPTATYPIQKIMIFNDCVDLLSYIFVRIMAVLQMQMFYGKSTWFMLCVLILIPILFVISANETYIRLNLSLLANSDIPIELITQSLIFKQASQWISIVNILEGFSTMIFVGSILYAICHPTRMKMSIVSQEIFYHVLGNMVAAFIEVVAGCSELVSDNVISRLTFHIPVFVRIYQFYIYTLLTKELNLLTTVDTMKIAKVHDMYDINKSAGVDDLSSHAIAVEQRRLNLSVQVKFAKIPEEELGNWQTSFKALHGGH